VSQDEVRSLGNVNMETALETGLLRHNSINQWYRYSNRPRAGRRGFDSRQGQNVFLYSTVLRQALAPTQPTTHWVPWAVSLGVKLLGRKAALTSI
jgi:hypothetical protein